MNNFLDRLWEVIFQAIQKLAATFDVVVSSLHFLGPITVIFLIAIFTVCITKLLKRVIRTRRLEELEKDFQHWMSVREEAMKHADTEKGRQMAKNIDKAELNRAYYDFFLEGLLLGFITFMLPVALMVAYINEYYRSERLLELFGQDHLFQVWSNPPTDIGAVLWFIGSIVFINISVLVVMWGLKKKDNTPAVHGQVAENT